MTFNVATLLKNYIYSIKSETNITLKNLKAFIARGTADRGIRAACFFAECNQGTLLTPTSALTKLLHPPTTAVPLSKSHKRPLLYARGWRVQISTCSIIVPVGLASLH